ncbi:hypothetical protein SRABI106_03125 [Rahnella aquatilis]|nr:hypothetical protein SRABI106_03125 [Rahnella aquatilis]
MDVLDPCSSFCQGFQRLLNEAEILCQRFAVGPGNLMNKNIMLIYKIITTHINYLGNI